MTIRKNSLTENLFLDRQGNWTTYKLAAKFKTINALESFAKKHNITTYGAF